MNNVFMPSYYSKTGTMSMYNGENEETEKIVLRMLTELLPGSDKNWYGTYVSKPDGEWDKTAEDMMLNFAESGHPFFPSYQCNTKRGIEKQREGNKLHLLKR